MSRRLRTVAIVGPDGAGKSAVVAALPAALPIATTTVYLGVNLSAAGSMLPTTRLARALKRGSGHVPPSDAPLAPPATQERSSLVGGVRRSLRLIAWIGEEWYRAVIVQRHVRDGRLVICDRHFVCDYYAADVAPRPGRPLLRRIHGWQLSHLYPRPDLVIVLDAPVEVLHARKQEDHIEVLARRRAEYLALRDALPDVVVIDATQPLDAVVASAAATIAERMSPDAQVGRATATSEAG